MEKYRITIIKPGILRRDRFGNILDARSTITLLQGMECNIIVDTGLSSERKEIVNALQNENLQPSDINLVILTHSHADHTGNIDLFKDARLYLHHKERTLINYDRTQEIVNDMNELNDINGINEILPGISIIETPGHTYGSISVIVFGTLNEHTGKFVITGDAIPIFDNFLKWIVPRINISSALAAESMWKIVENAEYIIPGHDKPFKILNLSPRLAEYLY